MLKVEYRTVFEIAGRKKEKLTFVGEHMNPAIANTFCDAAASARHRSVDCADDSGHFLLVRGMLSRC